VHFTIVIMSAILYAMIANEQSTIPLVEASIAEGNFNLMAVKLLSKLRRNASTSYTYEDKYIFHTHNADSLTYLCMAENAFSSQVAFLFLFDVKEKFLKAFERTKDAIALSAQREFGNMLQERLNYYNKNPQADRLSTIRANLERAREVMIENIDRVIARGERIEILVSKTDFMTESAVSLRRSGSKVKRRLCWKNLAVSLIIVVVVASIIVAVIMIWCQGLSEC